MKQKAQQELDRLIENSGTYRIFWLEEFNELLHESPSPLALFAEHVKERLDVELIYIINHLMDYKDDYVAILTYYSTVPYYSTRSQYEDKGRPNFWRIPVSTLELGQYSGIRKAQSICEARDKAMRCLDRAPIKPEPDESDCSLGKLKAYLNIMQKDVLAPVNLAEAFNVDFHLVESSYRRIIDEKLFDASAKSSSPMAKAEALMGWARLEEDLKGQVCGFSVLDSCLFRKEAVEKARAAVKAACARLKELLQNASAPGGEMEKGKGILSELASKITFAFSSFPKDIQEDDCGVEFRLGGEKLRELAICLLYCSKNSSGKGDTDLTKLWEEYVPEERQTNGRGLAALPTLPFFLLALYWNGTYRDLIRFILPPFLLDVQDLHIETVDQCRSPDALLYKLCRHQIDIDNVGDKEESLVRNVSRMISKNAIGNLAILCTTTSDKHHKSRRFSRAVRGTVFPLRQEERLAEEQRRARLMMHLEERRTIDLGTAFHDLRQPVAGVDQALSQAQHLVSELPNDCSRVEDLVDAICSSKEQLWVVKATISAQMRFARGERENFGVETPALDRYTLERVFNRLVSWEDMVRELWHPVTCDYQPCFITPRDKDQIYRLKFPFVSLYCMARELSINFLRYADIEKPAILRVAVQLDQGHICLVVNNAIAEKLIQDRPQFKAERRAALLRITSSEEAVDAVLGKDWTQFDSGLGIKSLFKNYLIQNFAHFSKDENIDPRVEDEETSHIIRISYKTSSEYGDVVAEELRKESRKGGGGTYNLNINVELPAGSVVAPL